MRHISKLDITSDALNFTKGLPPKPLKEFEDAFWGSKALEAEKSGYLGDKSLSELMRIKALKDSDSD